jgi:hypothetical protein
MDDQVRLRFNGAWYRAHNTSCLQKALAFGVGTALNVLPFVFAFHVRAWVTGRRVVLRQALKATGMDTGVTGLVMFAFMGTYCSLNNVMGHASVITATASGVVGCALLGMGRERKIGQFALMGALLVPALWTFTSILKNMAEDAPKTQAKD